MSGNHTSDVKLEDYCLGRVPSEELEDIEEHLLVCPACQERLRETDRYIRTMRAAISTLAAAPSRPESRWEAWFAGFFRPVPVSALAGLAALVLVWGVIPSMRDARVTPPVAVTLEALRGGGDTLRVRVPERTPLVLTLELTGVEPRAAYQVRLVDARGTQVFETPARPDGDHLTVQAPGQFAHGAYWIRLYENAGASAPLREYGLELQ
jgi:anti-sigma factor RsiW